MTPPLGDPRFRYLAHGYVVASEFPLPALPPLRAPAPPGAPVDLTLRRGEPRPVTAEVPAGTELGRLRDEHHRVHYLMARAGDDVTLRYPGACEFVGRMGFSRIDCHNVPNGDEDLVAVLASGTLLAVRLLLDGALVLHASAVVAGGAVAFIGASGMGKSTMAALSCAAGAELLSDDILRVDDPGGAATVWPGAAECRLREGSVDVAGMCGNSTEARSTADGRTAMSAPRLAETPVPLTACVLPAPSRQATRVEVRRLGAVEALLALSAFPRVVGWREPVGLARQFTLSAALVRSVPFYVATIPWGPPFRAEVAAELLDLVLPARAGLSGRRAPAG